jgi:hypothetical protein
MEIAIAFESKSLFHNLQHELPISASPVEVKSSRTAKAFCILSIIPIFAGWHAHIMRSLCIKSWDDRKFENT